MAWLQAGSRTDAHGQAVPDWDAATEAELAVWWQPEQGSEALDGRDAVIARVLILTNEQGIGARDRIVKDAETYEVDGPPRLFSTPAGIHHAEIDLVRTEG